jgi:hypothetical protein
MGPMLLAAQALNPIFMLPGVIERCRVSRLIARAMRCA